MTPLRSADGMDPTMARRHVPARAKVFVQANKHVWLPVSDRKLSAIRVAVSSAHLLNPRIQRHESMVRPPHDHNISFMQERQSLAFNCD